MIMSGQNICGYDDLIRKHYDGVAKSAGDLPTSTMNDVHIRSMETALITDATSSRLEMIDGAASIMDIGCGNGYTLSVLETLFPESTLTGVEYTDSLLEIAQNCFANSRVTVQSGDIRLATSLPEQRCDILLSQRVLINLLNPTDQRAALRNIMNLVKPGGLLIFVECFKTGLENLNQARAEFGLDFISPAHHNLYLEDDFFDVPGLTKREDAPSNAFSTHYYVSRVLHPLFLNVNQCEMTRNSHFVSFFTQALPQAVGDFAPLRFLTFDKQ